MLFITVAHHGEAAFFFIADQLKLFMFVLQMFQV